MTRLSFPLHYNGNRDRVVGLLVIAAVFAAIGAAPAQAHPLGNFSVNHLSTVSISSDRVDVRYILDQAEIPTVQERGLSRAEILHRKLDEVRRGLVLEVDGRPTALRPVGAPRLSFPAGAGGLATTRVELTLNAAVRGPRRVELQDNTFPGRVGWRAVVSAPGDGTAVRTTTPSGDPTGGLRRYPRDLLASPADRRSASFSVRPGDGSLTAPRGDGTGSAASRTASDGFAGLFADAASGEGVLLVLLAAAFGWGALHALSPGHGKAMVAAYLIGTRGTSRDAVLLGATVTVTHTIGVFALGLVTLGLSQYVLPEDLYPWLTLVSGLMVVAVGAGVLRSRLRQAHAHPHPHEHDHDHEHPHDHELGRRGLLGMGAAAGLIPCPSALVVLLAAIAQHEVGLGMLLIVAFSLGLAGTLTMLGLVVVHARRFVPPRMAASRVAALMPAASALLVIAVGFVLAARAVPGVV
jgi:nickel/cobalt transporter (NicO) family protein